MNIRNFSIIAHIDHGKSTLADRLIEFTGGLSHREMKEQVLDQMDIERERGITGKSTLADRLIEFTGGLSHREMKEQVLDQMDIERERGITIKAQTARLKYKASDGSEYILNLIDTPGHVDFSYEVSRSLAACEGVLLVIDASQGIEAQTLANVHLALEHNLEIIPVINKIDLPSASPEMVKKQIEDIIGIDSSEAILASAKAGIGIKDILEAIIKRIPSPKGTKDMSLRALVLDSWYDSYQGVVMLIRVFEGGIKNGMKMMFMANGKIYEVSRLGVFTPKDLKVNELSAGEVGYVTGSIKTIQDAKVGDTITDSERPAEKPLSGYKDIKPMVFSGIYPVDGAQYESLRDALEKLQLNDSSLKFEPETSLALGFGFRCGFLGLLHMDIVKERLEREFDLSLITTAPTVVYKVINTKGEIIHVDNPSKLPPPNYIDRIEEPYIIATIITPDEFLGAIMQLTQEKRGVQKGIEYIGEKRVMITYELPLNEVVLDFYDRLKSISQA